MTRGIEGGVDAGDASRAVLGVREASTAGSSASSSRRGEGTAPTSLGNAGRGGFGASSREAEVVPSGRASAAESEPRASTSADAASAARARGGIRDQNPPAPRECTAGRLGGDATTFERFESNTGRRAFS